MDLFKCGICLEGYSEDEKRVPRLLRECGHTICEICALKLLKNAKIVCPFDRIETNVNDGNIKFLKKNLEILSHKYEAEKALGIPCDEDPSHIAVFFCTLCEVHCCVRCAIASHSTKTNSHKIVKVTEKPGSLLFCLFHKTTVAELYCLEKDCEIKNKITCANCHLYGAHKSHAYKLIDEVYNAKMKETCETLKHTDTNIEIVRSCINDIGELPGNINDDQEYSDAKNEIDEIFEKRLEELNNWKQLNIEALEKGTKQKQESNKMEKEYFSSKLEELETLKLECSNTKQLKKTEYFEKLEEIEIIKEKLKCFEIKELEKRSMNPQVEYPNIIIFEKQESKGTIVFYNFSLNTEPMDGLCERIKQLGGIEYFQRKFQLEGKNIELLSCNMLRDCKDIKIKVFVILSFPHLTEIQNILGEKREKLKTDGLIIFGHSKQWIKDCCNDRSYWTNTIPEIAKHIQVPLIFANHEDSKFAENIFKGNLLNNPYFEKYTCT